MWILFAFLSPALYAVAEIFDEYLSNRGFKHISSLIFFACLLNFIFVPILFIIQPPSLPQGHLWLPVIGVGLTNLAYLYPYYRSLQVEDTSVVSAFFSLGKIIIPAFAFLFIGEILSLREYLGIGIIIAGNIGLAIHIKKKSIFSIFSFSERRFKLSKAFYLILMASTILAIDGILFKYMFEQGIGWSTAVGGQLLLSGFIGCVALLVAKKSREHIKADRKKYFRSGGIFFTEELFTFLGLAAETFAITLAPVSLVKGVGMAIPIFVLSYTVAVKRFKPENFHEDTSFWNIVRKITIFSLIIIGLALIGFED